MEKLSGHTEFLKRKGKLGIVDKKEQNIPLTTTEATIDEEFEDDYKTFTDNNIVTNTNYICIYRYRECQISYTTSYWKDWNS